MTTWDGRVVKSWRKNGVPACAGAGVGKDHTLYAKADGKVFFAIKGALKRHTVSIIVAA